MKNPTNKDPHLLEEVLLYLAMRGEMEITPSGERILRITLDDSHASALAMLAGDILERRQKSRGEDPPVGVIRMGLN